MKNSNLKASKSKYTKPKITEKKVKLNFFSNSRFFDSIDTLLVPQVFAQASACARCDCTSCGCGGCPF